MADIGIGDIVRDFKGDHFKILAFGHHTKRIGKQVVYQLLKPPYTTLIQDYEDFMSISLKETQKWKFEVLTQAELLALGRENALKEEGVISGQVSFNDIAGTSPRNFDDGNGSEEERKNSYFISDEDWNRIINEDYD